MEWSGASGTLQSHATARAVEMQRLAGIEGFCSAAILQHRRSTLKLEGLSVTCGLRPSPCFRNDHRVTASIIIVCIVPSTTRLSGERQIWQIVIGVKCQLRFLIQGY